MPAWTQNSATQSEVKVFILDKLYETMPQPPFTEDDIEQASDKIYNFIWAKSAGGGADWTAGTGA